MGGVLAGSYGVKPARGVRLKPMAIVEGKSFAVVGKSAFEVWVLVFCDCSQREVDPFAD